MFHNSINSKLQVQVEPAAEPVPGPSKNEPPTANLESQPPATQAEKRPESDSSCSTEGHETDAQTDSDDPSVISETSRESNNDFDITW